ncbi:MAG: competence/damage-inducible protein A [Haloarculaceae archaeon]
MRVAIVSVGDELLVGDTVNTNAAWLSRRLDERGVAVGRVTVLPDDVADIARVVNEYRAEFDAVVVTGGVGPTHDDVTMEGVAAAFGRELVASEAVERWLTEESGYAADDLAEGTTEIPDGARMLRNPEGVAPGCVVGGVYVLPGVPQEMKAMFETVADEFEGPRRHTETVHADEPESALLDRIATLREEFDVAVGSYPGEHVRVRLQGDDEDVVRRAAAWLRDRVESPGDEE